MKHLFNAPLDRLEEMVLECEDAGFCRACGEESHNVEPDARKYKCDACGANAVYGAEEFLLMGWVEE